MWSQRV
jgi:hypothetical protein